MSERFALLWFQWILTDNTCKHLNVTFYLNAVITQFKETYTHWLWAVCVCVPYESEWFSQCAFSCSTTEARALSVWVAEINICEDRKNKSSRIETVAAFTKICKNISNFFIDIVCWFLCVLVCVCVCVLYIFFFFILFASHWHIQKQCFLSLSFCVSFFTFCINLRSTCVRLEQNQYIYIYHTFW